MAFKESPGQIEQRARMNSQTKIVLPKTIPSTELPIMNRRKSKPQTTTSDNLQHVAVTFSLVDEC